MLRRTVITLLALALTLVGTTTSTTPRASADVGITAVTITYNDSRAAEFVDAVAQGVAIWNSSVTNVRIVRAAPGTRADVTVIADDGWPRATLGPVRPGGSGTVWMGRQAVNDGYAVVRIAAHEFGHTLGLPDRKPGPCSSLMSGSSAGVSCTNPNPNAAEISGVQSNYRSAARLADTGKVVVG
ncbi:snapalysin family zinc-dependent metalloprotease [Actinophytocola sp.]|jgi:snapalysin|uniref:snapalysin family zinc-dependent metalloprotease n=1 Tax=Actinophytocola sp. TaxID=1872138 RepID=UPI002ED822EB